MTNSQKLTIRASEIRQRLNEVGGMSDDELTDEIRQESDKLTDEYRNVETQLRAAIAAEPDPETRTDAAEDRELRALVDRADVGAVFVAALNHGATDGATRELQEHCGLGANQIPLAMLREAAGEAGAVEHRAVTPAPADVGQTAQPIVPYVFPQACAAFLGVAMPTVGVGEAVFPVLTSAPTVHSPAKNADADETTGSFSADVLSPSRLQASFFYSREDRARFAGMDSALRMALSDGLADALDKAVLAGTNGLLTGTNLANHAASALATFADYRSMVYSRVDGRYAGGARDVRMVMGAATYAHAAGVYRANNADDSGLDSLMRVSGGVKVSAHVPAVASKKQNVVIRRGLRRDMVAPLWEGVTIIPDEVTKAKQGQIVITAVMLHAVKILRADGFYKQEAQVAA